MPFRAAVGAQTFEQVVDLPYLEAGGIAYGGDMRVVQTEGFAAGLAVEMAVQFVDAAGAVVAADAVFRRAAAVFDLVQQVPCGEERQRAEDGGFVHALQCVFQFAHTECVVKTESRFVDEQTDGRGADAVARQRLRVVGRLVSIGQGRSVFETLQDRFAGVVDAETFAALSAIAIVVHPAVEPPLGEVGQRFASEMLDMSATLKAPATWPCRRNTLPAGRAVSRSRWCVSNFSSR